MQRFWKKDFEMLCNFAISQLAPLEKGTLYLNDFESSLPKQDLCQFWLKLAEWLGRNR